MIKPEASVQYNDFKGTSAADISDFSSLEDFATSVGLDNTIFIPQGISLYCGYDDYVSVSLLCEDARNDNKLISISLSQMPISHFLNQFKRLHVMLFKTYYVPSDEIEEISIEEL